ncbi:hypothetical protein FORC31_p051 (plasmid) [Escherichia coli]|nr:hypothetical protein FORC31_p051 [Escherichia coli]
MVVLCSQWEFFPIVVRFIIMKELVIVVYEYILYYEYLI